MTDRAETNTKSSSGEPRPQVPPMPRSAKPKPVPPVRFDDWALI